MKRVSRLPGGTVPRKTAGRNRGYTPPVLAPEPPRRKGEPESSPDLPGPGERGFKKGPTSEQFTAMAGAMFNALSTLRHVSDNLRRRTDANEGWLQPAHVSEILNGITAVENMLRVGLKARFKK